MEEKMVQDCIFCKIAAKEIPSAPIIETEDIIAFNDINPQAPVHVLVVPKKHYVSLNELDDEVLMFKLLQGVKKVVKKLNITEYRTVINTGKLAGQEVSHLHLHVLSGRPLLWPPG
jgi:histidine triad (HIT) family protein